MAVTLNKQAFNFAKELINKGEVVFDEKDKWSDHQPTTQEEDAFLDQHGYNTYSNWYLGIADEENKDTKNRYEFPFGDFTKVHRGGVIAAEVRAGQYKHADIENAAKELLDMINKSRQ